MKGEMLFKPSFFIASTIIFGSVAELQTRFGAARASGECSSTQEFAIAVREAERCLEKPEECATYFGLMILERIFINLLRRMVRN
jgi:hypothetical protein